MLSTSFFMNLELYLEMTFTVQEAEFETWAWDEEWALVSLIVVIFSKSKLLLWSSFRAALPGCTICRGQGICHQGYVPFETCRIRILFWLFQLTIVPTFPGWWQCNLSFGLSLLIASSLSLHITFPLCVSLSTFSAFIRSPAIWIGAYLHNLILTLLAL